MALIFFVALGFWLGCFGLSSHVSSAFPASDDHLKCLLYLGAAFLALVWSYFVARCSTLISGWSAIVASLLLGAILGLANTDTSNNGSRPIIPGTYDLVLDIKGTEETRSGFVASAISVRGESLYDNKAGRHLVGQGVSLSLHSHSRFQGRKLVAGSRVFVRARVKPVQVFRNPDIGTTPHTRFQAYAYLPSGMGVRVLRPPRTLQTWLARARHRVRVRLRETLHPGPRSFVQATFLGDAQVLSRAHQQARRESGLAHLFAVSGLHISLLAGSFLWILRRFIRWLSPYWHGACCAERYAYLVAALFAFAVAQFTGGGASATRAATMAFLCWISAFFGRVTLAARLLALSSVVLAIVEPSWVREPAFWLSLIATAALLRSADCDRDDISEVGEQPWIMSTLRGAIRVWIATLPLCWWYFAKLASGSIFANLVVTPVAVVLLLPLGFVHGFACLCGLPLTSLSGPLLELLVPGFWWVAHHLSEVFPSFSLPPPRPVQIGATWAAVVLILFPLRRCVRVGGLLIACLFFVGAESCVRHREPGLRIHALDVGQGDATLIESARKTMLIDAGGAALGAPDPGRFVLLPYLKSKRIRKIDLVVLTHPHPDHFAGLEALLPEVQIEEVWSNGQAEEESPDGPYGTLLRRLGEHGAKIRGPESLCDRKQGFGSLTVEVLWPCPHYDPGLDLNDNSLVLRIEDGENTMLFVGDLEKRGEDRLLAEGRVGRVDILKLGHHGSRTSTSPRFLRALSPRVAWVSAGRGNRYGHPHPSVVKRLQNAGVEAFRIDLFGGFRFTPSELLQLVHTVTNLRHGRRGTCCESRNHSYHTSGCRRCTS